MEDEYQIAKVAEETAEVIGKIYESYSKLFNSLKDEIIVINEVE